MHLMGGVVKRQRPKPGGGAYVGEHFLTLAGMESGDVARRTYAVSETVGIERLSGRERPLLQWLEQPRALESHTPGLEPWEGASPRYGATIA